MKEKILIVGAGGHARSVMDLVLENDEYEIIGCLDPIYPKRITVEYMEEVAIIGTDEDFQHFYDCGIRKVFIAIGANKLRDNIFDRVVEIGFEPVNIISKNARISERAKLGRGICVMAGAVVNVNCRIEDNCIVNSNCTIDHDCKIEKSVHIAPGATLSGAVLIGAGAQVGTGSSIIEGIAIGEWCFIGCGSTVVKDTESKTLAYGVPARKIKDIG